MEIVTAFTAKDTATGKWLAAIGWSQPYDDDGNPLDPGPYKFDTKKEAEDFIQRAYELFPTKGV